MNIWAIADLHLSFGTPGKEMDVFGSQWMNHPEKIRKAWMQSIAPEDLVLIPGDISWARGSKEASVDLEWVDRLPGTKVMIKGNHDHWWSSLSKVKQILPKSMHVIQNSAFNWNHVSIGGARLWDSYEYSFDQFIDFREPLVPPENIKLDEQERLFKRELERLELSLKNLDQNAACRIVMTHYPPIGSDLQPSRASALLEKYNVQICVFGHLHSLKKDAVLFNAQQRGIHYYLVSCDYLNFQPLKIL